MRGIEPLHEQLSYEEISPHFSAAAEKIVEMTVNEEFTGV